MIIRSYSFCKIFGCNFKYLIYFYLNGDFRGFVKILNIEVVSGDGVIELDKSDISNV